MAASLLLGAFDKVTHSPRAFSFFVQRAFWHWSTKPQEIKLLMESPFVGAAHLSHTFYFLTTAFYFARLTPKNATSLCASLVAMKLRRVKKLTLISLQFSLAQTPPLPLRMRSSTSLVRCKTLDTRSTLVSLLWLGNKKHKSLLKSRKKRAKN